MAYKLSAVFDLGGNYITQMLKAQQATGNMNKSLSTVTGGFSKLGSTIMKVAAVAGLGLGLKDMIDKAAAGQLKVAQLDAVLKSTGGSAGVTKDQVLGLATAQGQLTMFSKGANIETSNLLLTFTSIGKDVFPSALGVVNDMSTALGQDTKSSAVQLGKALQDPIKGITALSRVGVNFTENQKEQIKALVTSGKTMQAQKIILKELSTEFGGSAAAAGKTFTGQMTILKNGMAGVSSSLGGVLLPYLTDFVTKVNTYMPQIKQAIANAVNFIVPKFKEWIKLISQIAKELLPDFGKSSVDAKDKVIDLAKNGLKLVTMGLTWIRDNMPLVKELVEALAIAFVMQKIAVVGLAIAQGINTTATIAAAFATGGFSAALQACPIVWIIDLIALLGLAIYEIIKHWKEIKKWIVDTWDKLKNNPIAEFIACTNPFTATLFEIVKHWKDICEWVGKAWDWLKKWNGSKVEDKKLSVNTSYTSSGDSGKINGGYVPYSVPSGKPYATGTTYATRGKHLVGEHGPEEVDFKGGETVKTTRDSKGTGGSFVINMHGTIIREEADIKKLAIEIVSELHNASINMT